jgi:hypothetical protein
MVSNPFSKLLSGLLLVLAFSTKSYSQHPAKEATIARINELLGKSVYIEVSHDQLTVHYRDEMGKEVRMDKAPLADLMEVPFIEKESNLLCIPCMKDAAGCVIRVLIIQNVKREYDRVSIPVPVGETALIVQKAFMHLIRLQTLAGYKDNVQL